MKAYTICLEAPLEVVFPSVEHQTGIRGLYREFLQAACSSHVKDDREITVVGPSTHIYILSVTNLMISSSAMIGNLLSHENSITWLFSLEETGGNDITSAFQTVFER